MNHKRTGVATTEEVRKVLGGTEQDVVASLQLSEALVHACTKFFEDYGTAVLAPTVLPVAIADFIVSFLFQVSTLYDSLGRDQKGAYDTLVRLLVERIAMQSEEMFIYVDDSV